MATYALGDLDAFDVLFGRYEGRAYAFFLSRVRSHAHASDLFQELFLRVHRGRGTFRPGARFEPWFFQIARRVLIDDVRRRGPPLEALHEGLAGGASGDAERALQAAEAVAEVLAELTEEERVILLAAKGDREGRRPRLLDDHPSAGSHDGGGEADRIESHPPPAVQAGADAPI